MIVLLVMLGLAVVLLWKSIFQVREREVIVIQRCGKKHRVLTAGIHCVIPFVDSPKKYGWRYYKTNSSGHPELVHFEGRTKISTKTEVMDFPRQDVISRDNARITLDAIINYKVTDAAKMIYTTQNLPYMLSKLLQAQIRNVAGMLDVDKIVDDTTVLSGIQQTLNNITLSWGVAIEKVGVQGVMTHELQPILAKRKTAELENKKKIINANMRKQTMVVKAEGERDKAIRLAEGTASQEASQARGEAQAIINRAQAEARSISEIARALRQQNENPTKYLLTVKYIDTLQKIVSIENTSVEFMPSKTAFLMTTKELGLSTVLPGAA